MMMENIMKNTAKSQIIDLIADIIAKSITNPEKATCDMMYDARDAICAFIDAEYEKNPSRVYGWEVALWPDIQPAIGVFVASDIDSTMRPAPVPKEKNFSVYDRRDLATFLTAVAFNKIFMNPEGQRLDFARRNLLN